MIKIDINCDLGEETGNDEAIMPYISSANIACGFHAGNEQTMHETVDLSTKHNVSIGAHPGYPDRENFGRKEINLSNSDIEELVLIQITALQSVANDHGQRLRHVKAHGALYNQAAKNRGIADAIASAIFTIDPDLIYYGLPNSHMQQAAEATGLSFFSEAFSDRNYTNTGHLVPRNQTGAVISDPGVCCNRVFQLVKECTVQTIEGKTIPLSVDTICIHGDQPEAVNVAKRLHQFLTQKGVSIRSK